MKKLRRILRPDPVSTAAWYDCRLFRISAALGYVMFFIPLIMCPESRFAKFHANQALLNFVLMTFFALGVGFIPAVGWALSLLLTLWGIINAVRGVILSLRFQAKRIPLIGGIRLVGAEEYSTAY